MHRTTGLLTACFLTLPLAVPAEEAAAPDAAVIEEGRAIFVELGEPPCAVCHALKDAGSEAEVGPNLDELQPTRSEIHAAVQGGVGVMPAFDEVLTPEQIDAVSDYVAEVTGASSE